MMHYSTLIAPLPSPASSIEILRVFGILGFIKLNAGDFLVVATDRLKMGSVVSSSNNNAQLVQDLTAPIYRLTAHSIIPVPKSRLHCSQQQLKDDETYLAMLNEQLSSGHVYFSYKMDITNSLQRTTTQNNDKNNIAKPLTHLWETADDRFFWNRHLQSRLIDLATNATNDVEEDKSLNVREGFFLIYIFRRLM